MKFGTYVYVAVKELREKNISVGKTIVQKTIYFALPEGKRNLYYYPYYYGPYSDQVQQAIASTLKNENNSNDIKFLKVKDFKSGKESQFDDVECRIKVTAKFFAENRISQTSDISFLAKVHLLSRSERTEAKENLPEYIKKQAKFLGWKELAIASIEKIKTNIGLANNLEEALKN